MPPSIFRVFMIELPAAFTRTMQDLLSNQYQAFAASLEEEAPVSIRLHPGKVSTQHSTNAAVPWCELGRYLPKRPSFTLDPSFQAGAYYVQEASSMLVEAAFKACFPDQRSLRVLDLCAAPGGKTTLLASLLPEGSWLLANEVIRSRYQILRYNLHKWGYSNTFTSNHDVEDFSGLQGYFDLVLVDAPCSGEGLFRKDQAAREEWSTDNVQLCAARQGRILKSAKELVAPGGTLLYCTCTYNEQENDYNAQWLAQQSDLTYTPLGFPSEWGLEERLHGYQAYPHRVRGEGFYLAAFRKTDRTPGKFRAKPFQRIQEVKTKELALAKDWIDSAEQFRCFTSDKGLWRLLPSSLVADAQVLSTQLKRLEVGAVFGEWKGRQFVPTPEWALQLSCHPDLPAVEVDRDTALEFLRKNTPQIDQVPKGWVLIRYEGLNLGWVKGLGNRYNNYYPKHWRIRMQESK
ncbi:MAG: RNA methyltransferase [Bacteroidota bacterium]